jgi:hypothetical protein
MMRKAQELFISKSFFMQNKINFYKEKYADISQKNYFMKELGVLNEKE